MSNMKIENWIILNVINFLQAHYEDSIENEDGEGKADYVQTMRYFAASKHNGQTLRCQIEHMGYTDAQLQSGIDKAEKALTIYCKWNRDYVGNCVYCYWHYVILFIRLI